MSTDAPAPATASPVAQVAPSDPFDPFESFELDAAWCVPAEVSIRPEPFGALLYHFGTRRLSFLKSRVLSDVVRQLADCGTAKEACHRAGVPVAELGTFRRALAALAASDMIRKQAGP